ncbi:hypothetical protein, partial [Streptomonospora arabica]
MWWAVRVVSPPLVWGCCDLEEVDGALVSPVVRVAVLWVGVPVAGGLAVSAVLAAGALRVLPAPVLAPGVVLPLPLLPVPPAAVVAVGPVPVGPDGLGPVAGGGGAKASGGASVVACADVSSGVLRAVLKSVVRSSSVVGSVVKTSRELAAGCAMGPSAVISTAVGGGVTVLAAC